ncbi:MAG: hypothetical protein IJY23_04020 [Clostridia bacterium]|nr:hypothetical protein [Clostridia bacterium]
MIVVKKKMKKPLLIAILAAALAVLILAAVLINTLILAKDGGNDETGTPDPEILTELGESIYAKNAIAYTRVERSQMSYINIITTSVDENDAEYKYGYTFFKDTETTDSTFILEYTDKDGGEYLYYPPISSADPTFELNDIYAIDQNDSYKAPKLTYLCNAIGTLYFNERIKLSDDAAVKESELKEFGLSESEHPLEIRFIYTDKDGQEKKHTILIGDKLISGAGYYFTVDSRPYVYTTYSSTLDYAFLEFTDYISPVLTAAGLPQDSAFEPYLTTDFKQWKNTLYQPYTDKDGNMVCPVVIDGATVIINAAIKRPDYTGSEDSDPNDNVDDSDKPGGYTTSPATDRTFDLSEMKDDASYQSFINALVGKATGNCNISVTIPTYSNAVNLLDEESDKYTYEIVSIEAIVAADGDRLSGTVESGSLVKISYHLKKGENGETKVSDDLFYGVIDLSSELVPDSVKTALVGKSVGTLTDAVELVMDYDKTNTVSRNVQMVITDIMKIYDTNEESEDVELDKVRVGARVAVRCHLLVDGKQSGKPYEFYFEVKEQHDTDDEKAIAAALMDKSVGKNYEIKIDTYSINAEIIADFTTYEIGEISHFVTKEEVVSFEFQQASERDAYYGESLYKNTMQSDKYKMYALNSSSCEAILRVFGGLLENANTSNGLVGTRTVDVVLTPDKMLKYGLYAHTVYFELPRGITAVEYDKDESVEDYLDSLDDYQYLSTLGFTLYISEEDPVTKTRYMASDLYDIVVEVDGTNFEFLDYSFIEFYARKNVFLMNIRDIENIKLDFYMDDIKGSYNTDLEHLERYVYNGKVYLKSNLTEEQLASATKIDLIDVHISESGASVETALTKYLAENGITVTTLRELYGGKLVQGDSLGTDNYREFIETLFYTAYEGNLTEEEQAAGAANGKLLMRMSVELYEEYYHGSKYEYVFEFYRISDRRVMVKLSKQYESGETVPKSEVSDFYISSFSFKKLVSKYFDLLNARDVDNTLPYDEKDVFG